MLIFVIKEPFEMTRREIWDTVYGAGRPAPGLAGQCLHARRISFIHPRTGERVELECPLPDWFQAVLQKRERQALSAGR